MVNLVWANDRYRIAAELLVTRVEVVPIADTIGSSLDLALQRLLIDTKDDPGVWDDLVGSLKSLRWRMLTNPQPRSANIRVKSATEEVIAQASHLVEAVGSRDVVNQVLALCEHLLSEDPPVGPVLLESILEVGTHNCVVVASTSAVDGLSRWLYPFGVSVMSPSELVHQDHEVEQVYVVGPPRFFPSAVVTAPVSSQIAFLLPHWFRDRALPRSPVCQYAEGAFRVERKLSPVPSDLSLAMPGDSRFPEDDLLPQPNWTAQAEADHEPGGEEVMARHVLLSGDLGVYLDDGDRIRTLDPTQPPQERLINIPTVSVVPGTYLVLRKDESDLEILYNAALNKLGSQADEVIASQCRWKKALSERISQQGERRVAEELHQMGVKAYNRVAEWVIPTLDMPQRKTDFQMLLRWLGISEQPAFDLAAKLRRKRLQLGQEMRAQLEGVLSNADLNPLLRTGYLELPANAQFRGMIAARVLATAPYQEIVSRQRVRVAFDDGDSGGRWLE